MTCRVHAVANQYVTGQELVTSCCIGGSGGYSACTWRSCFLVAGFSHCLHFLQFPIALCRCTDWHNPFDHFFTQAEIRWHQHVPQTSMSHPQSHVWTHHSFQGARVQNLSKSNSFARYHTRGTSIRWTSDICQHQYTGYQRPQPCS